MQSEPSLDYMFRPRSTAVVGVSTDLSQWNSGRRFVQSLLNCGYKGKVYPVGLSGGEIFGLQLYPTIMDVPDTIDYVISAIPARNILQLIADCATKGVKTIHLFTSGFSEIGGEEESQLESQIVSSARQVNIRILGPNCMGLYCPKTGLSFHPDFPTESGHIGFISQSGGNCGLAVREGTSRGVNFSKVISYGNAADINETEILKYLTTDRETRVIIAYIEGVKDGRGFFQALRQAAKAKPVIIYKGGITEDGARAVASHTGSIAGSSIIWSSLLPQAGAIQVGSIEGLIDMAMLFTFMSPPQGKNIAVIGLGGGAGVLATDSCASAGLAVPRFTQEIRQQLKDIWTTEAGCSFNNPVDIFAGDRQDRIQRAIRVVDSYEQVDVLIVHIDFSFMPDSDMRLLKGYAETITGMTKEINKPTVAVLQHTVSPEAIRIATEAKSLFSQAGFPVFSSINRATDAISKFIQYHRNKIGPE